MSNIVSKKNVIYTSYGFGRNSSDFGHFENREWAKIQKKKIKEYCQRHNIQLKVIDYDNKYMKSILKNFDREKSEWEKLHETYTLSAIAAIYDFAESENENVNFFWMHLDMAINQMYKNIFDFMNLKNNEIYCYVSILNKDTYPRRNKDNEIELIHWDKIKLSWLDGLCKKSNLDVDVFDKDFIICNCSIITMNKTAAKTFVNILNNCCNIFDDNFTLSHPIIEETILELVELESRRTKTDFTLKCPMSFLKPEFTVHSPFSHYPTYQNSKNPNLTFVHFPLKENKHKIVNFYQTKDNHETNNNSIRSK